MGKKFLSVAILLLVLLLVLAGCGDSEQQKPVQEPMPEGLTDAEQIEWAIRARIEEGTYRNVNLDRVEVNANLGTEDDGDYIALVYLVFNTKNTISTGNDVMRMYSDDLVATLAEQFSNVAQAAIFWQDDYNSRNLKYAYEYQDGNFYLTDKME